MANKFTTFNVEITIFNNYGKKMLVYSFLLAKFSAKIRVYKPLAKIYITSIRDYMIAMCMYMYMQVENNYLGLPQLDLVFLS